MSLRIGRLVIEYYRRAVYITREPDPNCLRCGGSQGGWQPVGGNGTSWDWDECPCLDQLHTWRIPLAPWRRREMNEVPF